MLCAAILCCVMRPVGVLRWNAHPLLYSKVTFKLSSAVLTTARAVGSADYL